MSQQRYQHGSMTGRHLWVVMAVAFGLARRQHLNFTLRLDAGLEGRKVPRMTKP